MGEEERIVKIYLSIPAGIGIKVQYNPCG